MDRNLTGGSNFGGLDLGAQKELEDNFHHVSYRISLKIMFNALKRCLNDVRSVKNRTVQKNLARCPPASKFIWQALKSAAAQAFGGLDTAVQPDTRPLKTVRNRPCLYRRGDVFSLPREID